MKYELDLLKFGVLSTMGGAKRCAEDLQYLVMMPRNAKALNAIAKADYSIAQASKALNHAVDLLFDAWCELGLADFDEEEKQ